MRSDRAAPICSVLPLVACATGRQRDMPLRHRPVQHCGSWTCLSVRCFTAAGMTTQGLLLPRPRGTVCGYNGASSRAVARCVQTVSGVSRRTWPSADGPVLREANVSGMTENRRAVARMRRMAPRSTCHTTFARTLSRPTCRRRTPDGFRRERSQADALICSLSGFGKTASQRRVAQ